METIFWKLSGCCHADVGMTLAQCTITYVFRQIDGNDYWHSHFTHTQIGIDGIGTLNTFVLRHSQASGNGFQHVSTAFFFDLSTYAMVRFMLTDVALAMVMVSLLGSLSRSPGRSGKEYGDLA